ncbi:MAG: hypothetical protein Q9195_003784 [Heterodermia aff. obscurata]
MPPRRSPPRQHRSRSNAISASRDSSYSSSFSGSGISPRERRVISHPISQTPRIIRRHRLQAQPRRQPGQPLQRHISNGSYFQRTRHNLRTPRELLAALNELQRMLNGGQAQRDVSSLEPTRTVISAGDMQQRSQTSRFDGIGEHVLHQPTALDPTPSSIAWDVHEPTSNASVLYEREPTYLASNEASYGQRHQQQQTPPNPSHGPPCPHLSPVSPCERGPALSEEQRSRLLRSMPGYQSSSSPIAEPTLLHGRLAPGEERRSSVGMHDVCEDVDSGHHEAWPANGNTLASTGNGKPDWTFLDIAADKPSPPSNNWTMINASSDYQGQNPFPNGFPAMSDSVGQRPGCFPRDQESQAKDVELLTELFQNQKLVREGNHP